MASVPYVLCSLLSIFINFETCLVEYNNKQQQTPQVVNDIESKALFVFGDSFFDPGNDVYVNSSSGPVTTDISSVYWPYGETFFHRATGRYSDGRIVPDLIATFAGLPILPPYLEPGNHVFTYGANFASGGACVVPKTSDAYLDLPIQVRYFKQMVGLLKEQVGEDEAKRILSDAVYLFSIGGVDYIQFYDDNPDYTEGEMRIYVKKVIAQLNRQLREITRFGGKKIAFQSVAPIGCSPMSRISNPTCIEKANVLAREHNKAFIQLMKQLEKEVPGFMYSIFDHYNTLMERMANPQKYGFVEAHVACCGGGAFRAEYPCGGYGKDPFQLCDNPFKYLWFDQLHTGEGANLQKAVLMWEGGDPNVTYPYTVQQLFQL